MTTDLKALNRITNDAWGRDEVDHHLTNADPAHERQGPYVAARFEWHFDFRTVAQALRDWIAVNGPLTADAVDDALPGAQGTVVVTDSQTGLAYACIPIDEGDAASSADLARILTVLNR